ncbi:hypothetical protein H6F48_18750 [Limnothrix sp. FACHB-1088]|uniref:hypothetical protein n=1 Tax=Limnothrix sp. FACHB-1088 TaxID=2692816 RepID=UPI0016819642|nr:hypothetical protein [Limnothrix sp. FACHB-1088]MBD2193837.1 hypothetical protein [Limnothrix sp. FACHB-1088]
MTQATRKPRNTDRTRKALVPTRERQAKATWARVKKLTDAECAAAKDWINSIFFGA